jgi:valyl-tRNA synthetase
MELAKKYDFELIENKWKETWKKKGIYRFDKNSKKPIFSVDTPPPTVSGNMHIGHAASYSQQDFFVRYQRMKQNNVFFPFGTDDNGLPTERLVEKLKKVRSKTMGRSEFIDLCQKTIKEIKPAFVQDWRDIGMSCDFETTYSTLDNHCIKTSQKSFLDLFEKKLVYQKSAPTMWCVNCQTAIAQAELEDKEFNSTFNDVLFKVGDDDLVIATTRPELLAACVCVYVHPTDKRYKKIVGKKAKVPLFNHEVPIFADESADPEKGSGVLMVCSYGDKYDVEAITKRKLDPRIVFTRYGALNSLAGNYEGLKIKAARKQILEDLEFEKLLLNKKLIKHAVNVHDKCGTEVEFLESKQWFIEVLNNKKKLLKAADKINWYPEFMKQRYLRWVEDLQWDWSISRQRHFGVSFPVWYCKDCGKPIMASEKQLPVNPLKDKPLNKCSCGSSNVIPEEDVMDTWATSSVTPQIVLDWIKDNEGTYANVNFEKMYPMSLRPQAHDIIRTWAFYTIVKGLYHNNKTPWKNIAISGHVLDKNGKKMSKSVGNVVDPKKVLKEHGADVLRFWSASAGMGRDILFNEEELRSAKKTITKLWNASKFALMHLKDFDPTKKVKLTDLDKGIISKFNKIIKESGEAFDSYEYSKSKFATEGFFWTQFCDNYLEVSKDRLYNPLERGEESRRSAQYTLSYLLNSILKMFAPIMPFITEEIYSVYYAEIEKVNSIHISSWPKYDKKLEDEISEKMWDRFISILEEVRQAKSQNNKSLKVEIDLEISEEDEILLRDSLADLGAVTSAKSISSGKKTKIIF